MSREVGSLILFFVPAISTKYLLTNESSYMPDFFMDYLYSLIFVGIALLPTPPIAQFPPPLKK